MTRKAFIELEKLGIHSQVDLTIFVNGEKALSVREVIQELLRSGNLLNWVDTCSESWYK